MKVTFKFDDMLSSVEGTESEITCILIALGKLDPSVSAVDCATADYRAARREGDMLREAAKTLLKMGWEYRAPRPSECYGEWIKPIPSPYSRGRVMRGDISNYESLRRASACSTLQEMHFTYAPGDTRWRPPAKPAPVYDSSRWTGR